MKSIIPDEGLVKGMQKGLLSVPNLSQTNNETELVVEIVLEPIVSMKVPFRRWTI